MTVNLHFEKNTPEGMERLMLTTLYNLWCKQNGQELESITYTKGDVKNEEKQGA